MPGQPDWQRYQSSIGQPLYVKSGIAALDTSPWIPVGPWRAIQTKVTPTNTGVWTLDQNFASDAAGVNPTDSRRIVIGNATPFKAWKSMLGTYVQFVSTLQVPSAGDQLSVTIVPTLMESLAGARGIPGAMLNIFEQQVNHNNFVDQFPTYCAGGPAIITIRTNVYGVTFDLYTLNNAGVYVAQQRWQTLDVNAAMQYAITLPDQQFKIRVTNFALFAKATYDLIVSPA